MMLNNYFLEIKELADSSDEEICGFLLHDRAHSLKVYPAKNIASDRENCFEISTQDQVTFYKSGLLFGVYHSHVHHTEEFSEMDLKTSREAEIPFLLYSKLTGTFNYFCPEGCNPPFEGRQFVLGVQDCVSLVADYYKVIMKRKLPYFQRTPRMLEYGFDHLDTYYKNCGLVQVEGPPQQGDILLLSINNSGYINHAAVYDGNGVVLHQMMFRLSCRQQFENSWLKRVKMILRLYQ